MKNRTYGEAMEMLGLDHKGMAELLGFDQRSSRRYAKDRQIPETVSRFLRLILIEKRAPSDVNGSLAGREWR